MADFILNKEILVSNLKIIKKEIFPSKFLLMLKGNAYGHNKIEVAKIAHKYVDYFGVSNYKEYLEVKKYSKNVKVLTFAYLCIKEIVEIAKRCDEVSIFSLNQLIEISKIKNINFLIHLKINSGFNRQGFDKINEFILAQEIVKKSNNIQIVGIYSHLATLASDEQYVLYQVERFKAFLNTYYLTNKPIIHILSSGGLGKYKDLYFDMVRIGIAAYGYHKLTQPVLEIKAEIIKILNLKDGDSIGYDRLYICHKPTMVALLDMGYYEGIDKRLRGRKQFLINDQKVKIIGSISMDSCAVDITNISNGKNLKKVSFILTLNNNSNINQYELLTNLNYSRHRYLVK